MSFAKELYFVLEARLACSGVAHGTWEGRDEAMWKLYKKTVITFEVSGQAFRVLTSVSAGRG